MRKKCPHTGFFVVRIFRHSDSIFSANAGEYGPEKTPYLDTFHEVLVHNYYSLFRFNNVSNYKVSLVIELNERNEKKAIIF